MKIKNITLVSAFFPPSIGGPATFVSHIGPEFEALGYIVSYLNFEPYKKFSKPKRFIYFLFDLWKKTKNTDLVLIADTWSVLVPTAIFCFFARKKYAVRIGGDFLWETYVARTKEHVKLSVFYSKKIKLSWKEKMIFFLSSFCLKHAQVVIFNTAWQKDIWQKPYMLLQGKTFVVENALTTNISPYIWSDSKKKVLRSPVRASEIKNTSILKKVWKNISEKYPDTELCLDYIHPNEREKVLSETYAVIQSSISDVAPNLICESVGSGCPFICTQDTGIQTLTPSDFGIYVDTTNEKALQHAIESILDTDIHARLVKNIKDFKIQRTYKVLATEYDDICKQI